MSITIPVSIGEAFDKLSILEIKRDILKSQNTDKLTQVEKEIESLRPHLIPYIDMCGKWYDIMLWVNRKLWNCVDIYQTEGSKKISDINQTEYIKTCREIQQHNAARFRVKQKIERACNSSLREQKCHNKTKVIFAGHLGTGDQITTNGLVRYLSIYYDEVYLVVLDINVKNIQYMFRDDLVENGGAITMEIVHIGNYLQETRQLVTKYETLGVPVKAIGAINNTFPSGWPVEFYKLFYDMAAVPYVARWLFSFFKRDKMREQILKERCISNHVHRYIFFHDKPEVNQGVTLNNVDSALYVYHPNRDVSNNGTWQGEQTEFCIFEYAKLIEEAEEIHVVDSSFFCLCQLLDLSHVKKLVVYNRLGGNIDYGILEYTNKQQPWQLCG